jgi:broad specificity phosphatase PhoE
MHGWLLEGDRFRFFTSPMRRTLLTSQKLADGLGYSSVIVDPITCVRVF